MFIPLALIAAAVAGLGGPVALPAASELSCARSGTTIEENAQARVFQRRGAAGYFVTYGCALPRGRVHRLSRYDDVNASLTLDRLALAGRFVGFARIGCDGGFGEYCAARIQVRDLRSGAIVRSADAYGARSYSENVSDLALARNGHVAWISFSEDPDYPSDVLEVRVATERKGSKLLDSGEDVAARSLALAGKFVYWMRGGTPKSARLP